MKLKHFVIAYTILFLIVGNIVMCSTAKAFRIDKEYQRQVIDVDKILPRGTDATCWLAAFSTMAGFAVNQNQEWAENLYKELVSYFGNNAGAELDAWEHVMQTMSCGYDKYRRFTFVSAYDTAPEHFPLQIMGHLMGGWIVCIGVLKDGDNAGHALVVYGIDQTKTGYDITYVDSNDRRFALYTRSISLQHNRWVFDHNPNYYLIEFTAIRLY